jgi:hypothetical protein
VVTLGCTLSVRVLLVSVCVCVCVCDCDCCLCVCVCKTTPQVTLEQKVRLGEEQVRLEKEQTECETVTRADTHNARKESEQGWPTPKRRWMRLTWRRRPRRSLRRSRTKQGHRRENGRRMSYQLPPYCLRVLCHESYVIFCLRVQCF